MAFRRHEQTEEYQQKKKLTDAWCAAFVINKYFPPHPNDPRFPSPEPFGLTQGHLNGLASGRLLPAELDAEVERLSEQYQFFHWHLAFPEVFTRGGFDCVLGNPPWERVKLQEKEWFAERSPQIANAPNAAARTHLIEALKIDDPGLYQQFLDDLRKAEGESHILRNSGRYALCGRGDINVYAVFAEGMRNLLNDRGRAGCVLPTGIATDDTTKFFFQDVVEKKSLASVFDFENKGIFPGVHSSYKFCLFTSGCGVRMTTETAVFVFFAHAVDDLRKPERRFTLSAEDIALLNPNTRTCPIFRSRADAELTKAIYRRVPVLIREAQGTRPEENPWGIRFSRMFDMTNDSHLFRTREQLEAESWLLEGNIFHRGQESWLPIYEGKMTGMWDHRAAHIEFRATNAMRQQQSREITSEEHWDPTTCVEPYLWASESDVCHRVGNPKPLAFAVFKRVTAVTNERTFIGCFIPYTAVSYTLYVIQSHILHSLLPCFVANLNSFAGDYCVRQKTSQPSLPMGPVYECAFVTPETFDIKALPTDTPNLKDWIFPRVLELTYTAWDLEAFAQGCGWSGPPFRWDEERRFLLRCELDAAFFHLYLTADANGDWHPAEGETAEDLARLKSSFPTPHEAVTYIMDTFPIVKRKDEAQWGTYRTKDTILEIYDDMAEAIRTGRPYRTRLDPPPADPRCCHPPRQPRQTER